MASNESKQISPINDEPSKLKQILNDELIHAIHEQTPGVDGSQKDIEEIKLIICAGADVNYANDKGRTGLMFAANYGCDAICTLLLERGANIDARDSDGYTAVSRAYGKALSTLLQFGCEVDIQNVHGNPPEITMLQDMLAYKEGDDSVDLSQETLEIMRLSNRLDLCKKDSDGNTMLMMTTEANDQELTIYLMHLNLIDINAMNNDGEVIQTS